MSKPTKIDSDKLLQAALRAEQSINDGAFKYLQTGASAGFIETASGLAEVQVLLVTDEDEWMLEPDGDDAELEQGEPSPE